MITITISGYGAEVTQGKLPATVIDEIYERLGTSNPNSEELAEYLAEANFKGDHFSWFDIDDVFHSYGPSLTESTLTVSVNNEQVYTRECKHLDIVETETTEAEPFAGNLMLDAYGILTCEDIQKGQFGKITIESEKEFDVKQLKLLVNTLGAYSIITGIRYKTKEYTLDDEGLTDSKEFYAFLEE